MTCSPLQSVLFLDSLLLAHGLEEDGGLHNLDGVEVVEGEEVGIAGDEGVLFTLRVPSCPFAACALEEEVQSLAHGFLPGAGQESAFVFCRAGSEGGAVERRE